MHLSVENLHLVDGVAPSGTPLGNEDYVSMKGWDQIAIVLHADNATTVTGSVVTVKQATAVAGTGEKALSFATMYANEDTATNDTLVKTAVVSDTFTTVATNNLNSLYVIEIKAADMDTENDFDCIRVDLTDPTAQDIGALYLLSRGRYQGGLPRVSAITD